MERKVTLNREEQRRVMVLNEVEKGVMTATQAATVMDVSLRQVRRLLAAYRQRGVLAIAHGNRGRRPPNALEDSLKKLVIELATSKYSGFNQQHFTELLSEREGISLSRSSVRNILMQAGINSPRTRRAPRYRSRRQRYPKEGMLLQIDGSPHDWLEGRGPRMSLVGAIDDATGKVPYALFREQEDSTGYFILLREIVHRYGVPLAIYHDRHSIFEVSPGERETIQEQLSGKTPLTQYGRLLAELGIKSISALSPQAKGRIERLWGTFQDRLVSELRLEGISTLKEANRYLGDFLSHYNERFAIPPGEEGLAYRTAEEIELKTVFCFKHERVVGMDNVVRFRGQRLQILPSLERASYARCTVEVHEQLDGEIKVYYQGRYLDVCPAVAEATRSRELAASATGGRVKARQVYRPAKDHPWRQAICH